MLKLHISNVCLFVILFLVLGNVSLVYANDSTEDSLYEEQSLTELENESQTLVWNEIVLGSNGFWERSFQTVSLNMGNKLNFWYQNDSSHPAIVRLEYRNVTGDWTLLRKITVLGNEQSVRQLSLFPAIVNAPLRITVSNSSGNVVEGVVAVRQTSDPLS